MAYHTQTCTHGAVLPFCNVPPQQAKYIIYIQIASSQSCKNRKLQIIGRMLHNYANIVHLTSRKWHFKDEFNIYMLFEYMCGGELFSHLRAAGHFTSTTSK